MISRTILDEFKGKNCLVTGGTGMIGRQVVDILCNSEANVTSVSMDDLTLNPKARYLFGELTDFVICLNVTTEMDYVFHIAGIKGSPQMTNEKPASFFVPLLQMNTNILEACRLNGVGKVLYTSSIGAYPSSNMVLIEGAGIGPPMDLFPGYAKRMGEIQVIAYYHQYGLDNFAIVRPTNCYGPGDNFDPDTAMVVGSLMGKIARGDDPVIVWGNGKAIRDFTFSRDIAEGMILAAYHGTRSKTKPEEHIFYVNLSKGTGYTISELVKTMQTIVEFDYKFDKEKPSGAGIRRMDISRAQEIIGFNPTTSLREGLQQTWEWFQNNQDEYLKKQNYFREESSEH